MTKTIQKNCLNCTGEFYARLADHKRGRAKYCSQSCCASHTNALKPKIEHLPNVTCHYCQKTFYMNVSKLKNSRSGYRFCCREHKDLAQRLEYGLEAMWPDHYQTGDGETNYRTMALRLLPNRCNRCGYDAKPIWVVHHKDRDRTNNDISNLEILCPNCHAIEHWFPDQK